MKKLIGTVLLYALTASPVFAAKAHTINIPADASIAGTQVAAGTYKLSYEGSGVAVKVTLAKQGGAPIILDAKVAPSNGPDAVMLDTVNGVRVVREIDLRSVALVFDTPQ
jgi:hypothetical protein